MFRVGLMSEDFWYVGEGNNERSKVVGLGGFRLASGHWLGPGFRDIFMCRVWAFSFGFSGFAAVESREALF